MKRKFKLPLLFAISFMLTGCNGDDSELMVKGYESNMPPASTTAKLSYKLLYTWINRSDGYLKTTAERADNNFKGKIYELEWVTRHAEENFEKEEAKLKKALIENDLNNPDVKFADLAIKDASSIYGIEGNRIAVVDLGLPSGTKWGNCNLGSSVPTTELKGFDSFLTTKKPERPALSPLDENITKVGIVKYIAQKATASPDEDDGVVVTIPYSEYQKRVPFEELYNKYYRDNEKMFESICEDMYGDYMKILEENQNKIDSYLADLSEYSEVYEEAKKEYFKYVFENKYAYIYQKGNTYQWGLGQADDKATSFPAELDAATAVSPHLCTPTREQVEELRRYCTLKEMYLYDFEYSYRGAWYKYFVGPNGNKIGIYEASRYMINSKSYGYDMFEIRGTNLVYDWSYFNSDFLVRPVYKK